MDYKKLGLKAGLELHQSRPAGSRLYPNKTTILQTTQSNTLLVANTHTKMI
ncbi:MAG: hypothetical protein PHY04_02195 [Candidatus ainarchaeum sp.]|jgi:Glu-tRNA(Gln) amidotransferase subunit E-like FAD-binding protein|nr:hypothetical protein [Candidatus ainarchaeum sp.]HPM86132.1 hypothetical protein [archaeon]